MRAASRSAAIVGAGVAGRLCALRLARSGWRVDLYDDGAPSASAAAAGMIAPASEALLDGVDRKTAGLWRGAARLWPGLAAELRLEIAATGALHLAPAAELDQRAMQAERLGVRAKRRGDGLLLPEDSQLDASGALEALARATEAAGVRALRTPVSVRSGRLSCGGSPVRADVVVVAAGWGASALVEAAPELAVLHPIKGQLLRLAGPAGSGPVLRGRDVYLAPGREGWTVGATMEEGLGDLRPDPALLAGLGAAATAIRPELAGAPAQAAVGVRAATPDGRPLVGLSSSGLLLATGLRRNGWLLGPLVAETVAAYAEGRDPDAALGGQAHAWSPARFARPTQGPA